jgi:outer membrane protein OmpA-like peptidoglycan-associated protein
MVQYAAIMTAFFLSLLIGPMLLVQTPATDKLGCHDPKALSRMPGCWIDRCRTAPYEQAQIDTAKVGTRTTAVEGEFEQVHYRCPAETAGIQIHRNAEGALRQAGYDVVFTNAYATTRFWVTGRKGPQWVAVYAERANYTVTAVKAKELEQVMQANAEGWAQQINQTGRVSIYGINFDTGKATIRADSEKVLAEVAALLQKESGWDLLVAGHTDSAGTDGINVPLSRQRAEAVIAWMAAKGIDKARLTAAGFGSRRPLAENTSEDGRSRNRRVDLIKLY